MAVTVGVIPEAAVDVRLVVITRQSILPLAHGVERGSEGDVGSRADGGRRVLNGRVNGTSIVKWQTPVEGIHRRIRSRERRKCDETRVISPQSLGIVDGEVYTHRHCVLPLQHLTHALRTSRP